MTDINKYYGDNKPQWNPNCDGMTAISPKPFDVHENIVVMGNVLSRVNCEKIIDQFNQQPKHAVGVSGYADDPNVGSHRANAWATDLANVLNPLFSHLPFIFKGDGRNLISSTMNIPCPFDTSDTSFQLLGSTPWMRFMRYENGGEHIPHFDASFKNSEEGYVSLFSWVLYLNDLAENAGGRFQFVDDGQTEHPQDREKGWDADWREMADQSKVTLSIRPMRGTMLVFPHWLCHQVEKFAGEVRYIIRGDVAYEIVK